MQQGNEGSSAQEKTFPQTNRAGTKQELCCSRHLHPLSFPALAGVQDSTEAAAFPLLFSVQSLHTSLFIEYFPNLPPELRGSGSAWIPPQAHVLTQNWLIDPPYRSSDTSSSSWCCPTSICPGSSWQGPQTTNRAHQAKLSEQQEGFNFTHCCKTSTAFSQEHHWCSSSLNSSLLCVRHFVLQLSA